MPTVGDRHLIRSILLWAGIGALILGFTLNQTWRELPIQRLQDTSLLGAFAYLLAWATSRKTGISLASALAGVWLIALVYFVGILPMLAAVLLAASGCALGIGLLPIHYGRALVLPAIVGIAVYAGTIGWLLPYSVHYRFVYLVAFAIPLAVRRRELLASARQASLDWRQAVADSPRTAAFAVMVVGIATTGCWLPTMQFDDLAYHLAIPVQLQTLSYYRLDAHSQVWALAPWAGDVVQAMGQVLAGREARGAVDALWLLAAASLAWRLSAALEQPPWVRWLTSALFASLPLTAALAGGMHAELPATAILLALALAVAAVPNPSDGRTFFLVCALAGSLLGLKAGFLAATIPAGAWLFWRWRGQLPWRALIPGLALALAIAGSSYFYAYLISGNPLLPLFNGVFHSPFFRAENFSDPRWNMGDGLFTPWQIIFHSHLYLEGWDGAAGFSLIGLAGAVAIALGLPRLRPLALVGLVAFAIPLATVNYVRYTYPALVLLGTVMVAATATTVSRRNATAIVAGLAILNLAYQGASVWPLHLSSIKPILLHPAGETILARMAPERILVATVRAADPLASVLFCDQPFIAELAGRGFATNWYDPQMNERRIAAELDSSGATWRQLVADIGVTYLITSTSTRSTALTAALADAQRIEQIKDAELWRLPDNPDPRHDLTGERDIAKTRFRP